MKITSNSPHGKTLEKIANDLGERLEHADLVRSVFGPSQSEVWEQAAREMGGRFEEGGLLGTDALRLQSGPWEIVLDTRVINSARSSSRYTRMRTLFVSKDGLSFKIFKKNVLSSMGRLFGARRIEIGDACFDAAFVVKGSDPARIRLLLSDDKMLELIQSQPDIFLQTRDDEGVFKSRLPVGIHEILFESRGVLKDAEKIKNLFELFALTLKRMVLIDSADEREPGIKL